MTPREFNNCETQVLNWLMGKPCDMSLQTSVNYTEPNNLRVASTLLAYRYKGAVFLMYKRAQVGSTYIIAHAVLSDLLIKHSTLFFPHTEMTRVISDVGIYDAWILHVAKMADALKQRRLHSALVEMNLANNYMEVFKLNVPRISSDMTPDELETAFMACAGYLKLVGRKVPEIKDTTEGDIKWP